MHFTTIALSIATAFTSLVVADNCDPNYKYCGTSLMQKGRYAGQIIGALRAAGLPDNVGDDTLFNCLGGPNGDIQVRQYCGASKCVNAGSGAQDYCS